MSNENQFGLFEAFGVELEYMIVASDTLDVMPISDKALTAAAGELTGEVEMGSIAWSNELALHVLELKVAEPARDLTTLADDFQASVERANEILAGFGAQLLPTAMHPWMNPDREMKIWPHDYSPVYEAFNRIFNCRGHGWANLQSTHWNLPFKNEEEFARLHAAIRLILPMLPGIAASSPIYDGRTHHKLDCRLDVYRRNSAKIPSITGSVVPEPVYTEADYEREIYQRMYRDIAPEDPEGTLQHIWLNARGAIARFDRGAIEIRVIDIQECPSADIAIGSLMVAALQSLCGQAWTSFDQQSIVPTEKLAKLFIESVQNGPFAMIPSDITRHFGCDGQLSVGELWQDLRNRLQSNPLINDDVMRTLDVILEHGTLSQRILASIDETVDQGNDLDRDRMRAAYGQLGDCLATGKVFPFRNLEQLSATACGAATQRTNNISVPQR